MTVKIRFQLQSAIMFGLIFSTNNLCAQDTSLNKYGLWVIKDARLFNSTVQKDSINQKPGYVPNYTIDSIKTWLANKERKRVIVKNHIPLYIRYFTCEGKNGKIVFYDDIYGEDKMLREKYFAGK